jgi:hypothetical protein
MTPLVPVGSDFDKGFCWFGLTTFCFSTIAGSSHNPKHKVHCTVANMQLSQDDSKAGGHMSGKSEGLYSPAFPNRTNETVKGGE